MNDNNNWITIWDNTSEARIVYVSESVTDNIGWDPEDIIGREAYSLFHPIDHDSIRKVHIANIRNEKMSTMITYRSLCKDGSYALVETVVHYCHDVLVGTCFRYDENSLDHKMRANSVDEVFICLPDGSLQLAGAWNDRQEVIKKTFSPEQLWVENKVTRNQERRFCLILNRFAEKLNIVYVFGLSSELVHLDIPESIGMSFFDFVSKKDIAVVRKQIDLAKEHGMVARLRFDWLINHEAGVSKTVEAITSSTNDGVVMVLRLSPSLFVDGGQKQLQQ